MLFAFRGIRMFQVMLAIVALATGIGATLFLKSFVDTGSLAYFFAALLLGLVFLWAFATALRAPTSFVAVAPERTRIRFAGFVDTVVDNRDILGVRVKHRNILGGIGVRTNFAGDVALVSTWGDVAEIWLRNPIRVWLVPRLIPLRATRLTVSVRHPAKLEERFGQPRLDSAPRQAPARRMKRGGSRTR